MYDNFKNPTFNVSPPPTELEALRTLSELVTRSRYARGLGMSFSGARDLYEVLGWKREIRFQDYWNEFERNGIGKRIITAPVASTWYGKVSISETQKQDETTFEKTWKELDEKLSLIPKLIRLDILSGIGRYGVLLLGFSGVEDFSLPFTPGQGTQLLYVQPYHEDNAKIIEWETNARDPRYGKPKMYQVNAAPPDSPLGTTRPLRVHWTRILHVAEGCLENDVFGTPRLLGSFNRIQDIDKLAGGSAEMFWQGALGGRAYVAKENYKFGPNDMTNLQTEIDEYVHGLRRYQRLQGVDVQDLSPQVSSPKDHIDVQLDLISGDTGIPKRLLIGSERGELASSQDAENWNSRVQQRREQFAEPFILRPFVNLLIQCKILPEVAEGYQIEWTPLTTMGRKETVEVSKIQTETIAAYVNAPGAELLVPEEFFLEEVVGFSRDQIDRIKESRTEEPILHLEPEPVEPVIEEPVE